MVVAVFVPTVGYVQPGAVLANDESSRVRATINIPGDKREGRTVAREHDPAVGKSPSSIHTLGGVDGRGADIGMIARSGTDGEISRRRYAGKGDCDRSVVGRITYVEDPGHGACDDPPFEVTDHPTTDPKDVSGDLDIQSIGSRRDCSAG